MVTACQRGPEAGIAAVATALTLMLAQGANAQCNGYTVEPIPPVVCGDEVFMTVTGINSNAVVGVYHDCDGLPTGFIWDGDSLSTIPVPPGFYQVIPGDCNDMNHVSGTMGLSSNERAFLYIEGRVIDLGTPPGGDFSWGWAVNDSAQVCGTWGNMDNDLLRPFIWQDGIMTDLNAPPGLTSRAFDINDHGKIIGVTEFGSVFHPFLWDNGDWIELPSLPEALETVAWAINNNDLIVGHFDLPAPVGVHTKACAWSNSALIELPLLPGCDESIAFYVNDYDMVVGGCSGTPLLWWDDQVIDLSPYVPPDTCWDFLFFGHLN